MLGRRAVALLVVAALPFLAGCNFGDWYDQMGTVKVDMSVLPANESAIGNFTLLNVVVNQVQVRQVGAASPETFRFNEREVVDLVSLARSGGAKRLVEAKFNLRAIDEVLVFIEVTEAVDAAGKRYGGCFQGEPTSPEEPCVRVARSGSYPHDDLRNPDHLRFSPDRGGTIVITIPFGVQFGTTEPEYFIMNKQGWVRLE